MNSIILAGLLLGGGVAAGSLMEHQARIEHATGPVDARYRGDVAISHKQVGAVGPGGRPSTLACTWRANVAVTREARHPSGSVFTRSMARDGVIEGRRPGWCVTQRQAIAREVAQRRDELRSHLIETAQEDHHALRSEIDRAHSDARAG